MSEFLPHFEELLGIDDIQIESLFEKSEDSVTFNIRSLKTETICPKCASVISATDGYDKIQIIRHLPIFSKKCFLRISPRRYKCPCGCIRIESFSWRRPRSKFTREFEDKIALQVINSTIEDVSLKEAVSYDQVLGILNHLIEPDAYKKNLKISKLLESMRSAY